MNQHGELKVRELYPEIEPYRTTMLKVSDLHTLYVEEVGNPEGRPCVLLHGGPGGGVDPVYRRFFDPAKWRVILFDQRGCGKSTPFAELRENTTWDLVADIETIREHCGVEGWAVFGGSWGSTLALAYAQTHPERCRALFLRGIFLCRQRDIDWLYVDGMSRLFPDKWQEFIAPVADASPNEILSAYYKILTGDDEAKRIAAAKAWSLWEARTSNLIPDPKVEEKLGGDHYAQAFARIETHYFVNQAWLGGDEQLLKQSEKLRDIPGVIVHGRYDALCPAENAWLLHQHWPRAELHYIADAGHSMMEPGIRSALIDATDRL